ncbi:MAG: hypothetical protein SPM02_00880 [Bacteroidales bacterium]|nr:hypothetical protein [Bacteroidales bacterium]
MVKSQADSILLQQAGEPSLAALNRDSPKTLALLKLNIAALDRFFHLKNPLGEDEIDFIAEQIIDEFGGALTFADIHIVLRDIKAGKYGKLYERLSAPDVLSWFRDYFSSRLDAAYEINLQHDKSTYAAVPSSSEEDQYANLARLGYGINPDGSIGPNKEKIEQINTEQERQRQAQLNKAAEQIKKNNEEALFMAQYREAERTGTVKEFLASQKV